MTRPAMPVPPPPGVTAATAPSTPPAPRPNQVVRIVVGLALPLPAVVALMWSYVIPSVSTVVLSFGDRGRGPGGSGGEEYYYGRPLEAADFVVNFGFAALLGLVPIACALLVAPVLAVAASHAGRAARLVTRGLLALPLAAYAPAAAVAGWHSSRIDGRMLGGSNPRFTVVWIVALTSFGLVVAVAATLFLSALRAGAPPRRTVRPMLIVGAVLVLGILAAAVQSFTAPAVLGPIGSRARTPLLDAVQIGALRFETGLGARISAVLLVILGVLGLAAVGLLLTTRARIEVDPVPVRPAARPVAVAVVSAGLGVLVAVVGYAVLVPLLSAAPDESPLPAFMSRVSISDIVVNTWLPPLISAVVSVALAALAGFGIGALRPLGRWSELLLLPFAPWLFVGDGPLALAQLVRARSFGQVDSFVALIPPGWLSIPALVAFTLLFRGQVERRRPGDRFPRVVLLPALPMLALALLLTWLVSAQSMVWPTLVAKDQVNWTAPMVFDKTAVPVRDSELVLTAFGVPMALFLIAFAALQVGYLDRLAIRLGDRAPNIPVPAQPETAWTVVRPDA